MNLTSHITNGAITAILAVATPTLQAEDAKNPTTSSNIRFQKQVLTSEYYCDGITSGDINRDGNLDVVAGPFWYEGPGFTNRHEFYEAKVFPTEPSPTDSMFSYVHDFNGDGWPDILVLGRVHLHEAFWHENPQGREGKWTKHFAFHRVQGESPTFVDADGDGKPELVAHDGTRWGLIQPDWKNPTNEWRFKPITAPGTFQQFYHGEGIGDVNHDGRNDLILNEGWYEQPANRNGDWIRHEFKFADKGGAQMFALDVNGDGVTDIITALDAHGWGLAWFEQLKEPGQVSFKKHIILGTRDEEPRYGAAFSQPHALAISDLDGDGLPDIVTGKRMWAHGPKGDIEPSAAPVLYWFRLVREKGTVRFEPHLIDNHSGVGVQVSVADMNKDGRPDILTVSKLGTFVFWNKPAESSSPHPNSSSTALEPIDVSGFGDSRHHWRHVRSPDRFIQVVPDQPSYAPAQVREIVTTILLFQRKNGGWPKDYDMTAVLTGDQQASVRATHDRLDTSFDNGNIHSQVAYLARAYTEVGEPVWRDACLRGFDFMLAAQYPNGGFPQRYPGAKDFHAHVTFNDYVMIGILNVLQDAVEGSPPFTWLDAARRERARDAVRRGVDCILKCQIRVNGKLTGWCQQHDQETFEARPARGFELASICPQDTTYIVRFLMRLESPGPDAVRAADAAVDWMQQVKLSGTRVERVKAPPERFEKHDADFDLIVVQDAKAPPVWARHYEIGSNRPIFANYDAVKRYSLAEIGRERRTGSAWYGQWPLSLLERDYPEWRAGAHAAKVSKTDSSAASVK